MALIVPRIVKWETGDAEVNEYRIYYEVSPAQPSYVSSYVSVSATVGEYDLKNLGVADGEYNLGLVAVDAAGNQSDIIAHPGNPFPLDFTAPANPVWIV